MAKVSQNTKYVKLDDGVSFALVRTNPKLTTNTKLMYNGKRMYMESYASSPLMNTLAYKNVSVRHGGTFNKDIANFLKGSGSQAYGVCQNFSNIAISDSYDNQFETLYWCGAEYIDSSFYTEEIGFVAPLYLREKLPNYFLIFRLDTPSNFNFNVNEKGEKLDSTFDFKTDILDKAVLIKTFDLREGSVLGNYIHNYVNQDGFEFDKSMHVNFSNAEVTYYGINKVDGVLETKVESFENELLKSDNPILKTDKWFTEGFERNNLIFPYIMNIEYLFDDENFTHKDGESYDFARYIGLYCNNIEFGEFEDFNDIIEDGYTQDNAVYYFEDNKQILHRYSYNDSGFKIDGKDSGEFDKSLIKGYEKERITGFAEPLDAYEGFINRAQYGFEIKKPFEPGDWIGIEYNGHVECYFADNKTIDAGIKQDMAIGEYEDFRFSVNENSSLSDIAMALSKCINRNKKSAFEAEASDNIIAFYAKREGKEYNNAKIMMESSLLYNRKISLPISKTIEHVRGNERPIEFLSDSDLIIPKANDDDVLVNYEKTLFGDYYTDKFSGACDIYIDPRLDTYKNAFKIYTDEYILFDTGRYLKTNNGEGREIVANMVYINGDGKIEPDYRIVIVDDVPEGELGNTGYDISISSTYQVEILDKFKPNYGILSWFPVKDFDFDINYSTYGQYDAFNDECEKLSRKITYEKIYHTKDTYADSDSRSTYEDTTYGIKALARSPFVDEYGNSLTTEYDYYLERIHPDLCLMSKTAPYISKWGYYDEQKDSCENPYRLNVSKVFGVSNLSANTYLRNCDENEYTHSMPYYMTLRTPNYFKEYQYIESDKYYASIIENIKLGESVTDINNESMYLSTFFDCVDYWVNQVFMRTDVDMFSEFFRGKKCGKRFDRKYSRLLCGDKLHNPSTLFRGVKFEAIRQYNGVDKMSSEYNDYKFSFVYIPIMIDSMIFDSTVYFVKNDTFKFIVGIVFVNTMLGTFKHNIFGGSVDYFNKGFLYAACKDIIRPENIEESEYELTIKYAGDDATMTIDVSGDVWKDNYDMGVDGNKFYMWICNDQVIITTTRNAKDFPKNFNVIGEFNTTVDSDNDGIIGIEDVIKPKMKYTLDSTPDSDDEFNISWSRYYAEYDATVYGYKQFKYYGDIDCKIMIPDMVFNDIVLVNVCNIDWSYYGGSSFGGYVVNVSNLYFKSGSLQNILINLEDANCIESIEFYSVDSNAVKLKFYNEKHWNNTNTKYYEYVVPITVVDGNIKITSPKTAISVAGNNGEIIENLRMNIVVRDKFDKNSESLGLKDYFSSFNQLSMYSLTDAINNDYNVKYFSTTEDNKYKIRIIEPDSIEIEDKYEAVPVTITQNNKNVLGSVDIKEKSNVDRIGIKVINRYSGYYNPIFNDILYYGDYTYTSTVGRLRTATNCELPYSNTNIDYNYSDNYGDFGVIKNMYYHKTNISRSDKILTYEKPTYPAINEYALDYRDYNIFSSSWDEGYFISQDDLETSSICNGIGSMKDGLCMFGSKYLNLPDYIFVDTFQKGNIWGDKSGADVRDNTDMEIMYKEINNRTVKYHLFVEKRLVRYLTENLFEVFSKYINKNFSFGNKGTIEDDVKEYVEKNLLKLYKVDKVYMYIKGDTMRINDAKIENNYLEYVNKSNEEKIKSGFPTIPVGDGVMLKESNFTMSKSNEFDRIITYNLKSGFKESFGFAVSFRRK